MTEILCKKTGKPLMLCNSKFKDCSDPVVSAYTPETETGWQECSECGEVRHYRREIKRNEQN